METSTMKTLLPRRAALVLVLGLASALVHAQGTGDWPKRQPIKLVAVFPPGGSVDQVARILAPALQQQLGQSVVVDTHGVNPSLIPNLAYDTKKDLVPLVLVGTSPMVLATYAGSDFKTFADVVAAAKAKKPVSYGSIGSGSLGHVAMTLLGRNGGLEWTHVPYRGGGPMMNDAVAGHVPLSIGSVFVTKPHIDSKRLRPLVVTSSKRSPELPDVPTVAESGFPGFDAPAWWAVLAPAKTPPEIVKRLNEELNKALKVPDIANKLAGQGIAVIG